MSVKILSMVWEGFPGGGSELLAMLALADWSDDAGRCWPSIPAVARKVRLSPDQARRVVHRLIESDFLSVTAGKTGGGSSRRYQIRLDRLTPCTHATPCADARGGTRASPPLAPMQGHPLHSYASRTVIDTSEIRQEAGGRPPAADTGKKPSAMKGSRLAADWQLPKAWGEWALAEVPGWTADHVRKVGEMFGDYWRSKAGKDAAKADWMATWRNWVRREAGRNGPATSRGAPTGASDPFRGCL